MTYWLSHTAKKTEISTLSQLFWFFWMGAAIRSRSRAGSRLAIANPDMRPRPPSSARKIQACGHRRVPAEPNNSPPVIASQMTVWTSMRVMRLWLAGIGMLSR